MNAIAHAAALSTAAADADAEADAEVFLDSVCQQACDAIAPAWPLDRAIAVNPHWKRIGLPLRQVAARMAVLGNIQVFPTREYVRQAWDSGRIGLADLEHALATLDESGVTVDSALAALQQDCAIRQLPLLIDVLDDDPARYTRLSWRQAITHQVSQTCAAYFDHQQAGWQPQRGEGLFAFWRATLAHDHGIGTLMGLPLLGQRLHALPATRQDAERWALRQLGLPHHALADYLEAVLLTVNGWASWCAYLGWQAKLEGGNDDHLRDLLAIRLAWGAVLLECKTDAAAQHAFAALKGAWRQAPQQLADAAQRLRVDEVWQLALDAGYQRQLAGQLSAAALRVARPTVEVQAAFCIDVRSERLRRALEAAHPGLQTLGFAGFFGLPISYTPLGSDATRPQLPGLLAPALAVRDALQDDAASASAGQARQQALSVARQWQAGRQLPAAAFSFVEAAGVGYLGKLAGWLRPASSRRRRADLDGVPTRYRALVRPVLQDIDVPEKVTLAARVLHAMGLDRELAPLVLLVGHGSQSANNAHAAALDCGACCGQTGEVNARVLAGLLNDTAVRAGLAAAGIDVPADTAFVAALHNTTTDELEWFDLDLLPPAAQARVAALQTPFEAACDQVRRERAPTLALTAPPEPARLLEQLRRRANDGAQTRVEWGLANNAAFVIAPRERTRALHLDGRAFLHDYDATADADGSVLELLMTAPMLVTHWINWQYHASTCDPSRLGSGNKVLHNVVGGHLGVFEGNGGDLRIGLAKQSVHDGEHFVHEPVRLTVAIDAPQAAIDAVLARHAVVRELVEHGWLHLWQLGDADHGGPLRRTAQGWQALDL